MKNIYNNNENFIIDEDTLNRFLKFKYNLMFFE